MPNLDPRRGEFVTASTAHRVMAEFEEELTMQARKFDFEINNDLLALMQQKLVKPLISVLKTQGIKITGAVRDMHYEYVKSLTPVFTKGMESYALELVNNYYRIEDRSGFKTEDTERGNDYEQFAVEAAEKSLGFKFDLTGKDQDFFSEGSLSCTPDGVKYNDIFMIERGLEVKCPNDNNHIFNFVNVNNQQDLLKHHSDYYWQCQTALHVTGAEVWYWASWNNNRPEWQQLKIIEIRPNELHINLLKKRADRVIEYRDNAIKKIEDQRIQMVA